MFFTVTKIPTVSKISFAALGIHGDGTFGVQYGRDGNGPRRGRQCVRQDIACDKKVTSMDSSAVACALALALFLPYAAVPLSTTFPVAQSFSQAG